MEGNTMASCHVKEWIEKLPHFSELLGNGCISLIFQKNDQILDFGREGTEHDIMSDVVLSCHDSLPLFNN